MQGALKGRDVVWCGGPVERCFGILRVERPSGRFEIIRKIFSYSGGVSRR